MRSAICQQALYGSFHRCLAPAIKSPKPAVMRRDAKFAKCHPITGSTSPLSRKRSFRVRARACGYAQGHGICEVPFANRLYTALFIAVWRQRSRAQSLRLCAGTRNLRSAICQQALYGSFHRCLAPAIKSPKPAAMRRDAKFAKCHLPTGFIRLFSSLSGASDQEPKACGYAQGREICEVPSNNRRYKPAPESAAFGCGLEPAVMRRDAKFAKCHPITGSISPLSRKRNFRVRARACKLDGTS